MSNICMNEYFRLPLDPKKDKITDCTPSISFVEIHRLQLKFYVIFKFDNRINQSS